MVDDDVVVSGGSVDGGAVVSGIDVPGRSLARRRRVVGAGRTVEASLDGGAAVVVVVSGGAPGTTLTPTA